MRSTCEPYLNNLFFNKHPMVASFPKAFSYLYQLLWWIIITLICFEIKWLITTAKNIWCISIFHIICNFETYLFFITGSTLKSVVAIIILLEEQSVFALKKKKRRQWYHSWLDRSSRNLLDPNIGVTFYRSQWLNISIFIWFNLNSPIALLVIFVAPGGKLLSHIYQNNLMIFSCKATFPC